MENSPLSKKGYESGKADNSQKGNGKSNQLPTKQFNYAGISKPFLYLCKVSRTEKLLCL